MAAGIESACSVGDWGLIPGLGRSPGEGNVYPLQYSGLENSMDCSMGSQRVRHDWATFTFTIRREMASTEPERRKLCEDRQRMEWCCHKPRNVWSHQKLSEVKDSFLEPSQGCGCPSISVLDFQHPEPQENTFLLFKPLLFLFICYRSPGNKYQEVHGAFLLPTQPVTSHHPASLFSVSNKPGEGRRKT